MENLVYSADLYWMTGIIIVGLIYGAFIFAWKGKNKDK